MNNYWHTNYAASQGGAATFRFRISLLAPGDAAEPVRRGWAACDPLYVSSPYNNATPGPLIAKDRALFYADKGVMIVGAKAADDGDGAVIKLLDVAGQPRALGLWPAAYAFKLARRTNLVELNGDAIPSAPTDAPPSISPHGVWQARGSFHLLSLLASERRAVEFAPKDAQLRDDVRTLGALVGDVLREQCGDGFFQLVERAGTPRSPGLTMSCRRL